jgi:hypothetical protein
VTTRKPEDVLKEALDCVCTGGTRERTHGDFRDTFEATAALWTTYLGVNVSPMDVCLMFDLAKTARIMSGVPAPDHFVDKAGYAALAGALAGTDDSAPSA